MLQAELQSAHARYFPASSCETPCCCQLCDSCKPHLYFDEAMFGPRSPVATPCPGPGKPGRCREVRLTTSSNTDLNIPWQLLCRAACCRHPSFETTFVDTNEVLYLRATLTCACICLSFVVPCRCNCAITKNGSFIAIDADQPSITCDRRYESEVVATTLLLTPRS
jgi:hypothetical protein